MNLKEYLLFKREKAHKAHYHNSVADLDKYITELEELYVTVDLLTKEIDDLEEEINSLKWRMN